MTRHIVRLATAAVCAVLAPPLHAQQADEGASWRVATHVAPIGATDRVHGAAAAQISVIVWLDPECPYCKLLGAMPEQVVDQSGGKVNLAVRLYPLPFHGPNATLASLSALCVADQAGAAGFYRFLDGWLAATGGNGRGLPTAGSGDPVADLAASAGARDLAALAACTTAPQTGTRLKAEMTAGETARVGGTPSIAVRNNATGETIMVDGAIGEDDMKAAINFMAKRPAQ